MCIHSAPHVIPFLIPDHGIYFISNSQRAQLAITASDAIDALFKSMHHEAASGTDEQYTAAPAHIRPMIQDQYAQLRAAIHEGAGKLAFQVQYGTPNNEMLQNLQKNIGSFAAFKNHSMMGELVSLLKDSKGHLKPFHEFRKDALTTVGQYRETWLQTEYDSAVRASRMATVWQSITRTKNLFPNIKYIRSRSAKLRPDHFALIGTVLPIDHPFWQINFPPNGYGCECGVQATDDPPTDVPGAIDVHPVFSFNPGIQGKVFDLDNHPFTDIKASEYKQVAKEAWGALCSYERKQLILEMEESGYFSKRISVPKLTAPVTLNRASVENTLFYDSKFLSKASLLYHINDILMESELVETESNTSKQHIRKVHTLHYITPDGQKVSIRVDDLKDGKCVLHSLRFIKK
jgi:hypothetical protein